MTSFISFLGLHAEDVLCYSLITVAKSAVGISIPFKTLVTPDAPCAFFCVYALVHLIVGRQIVICHPYRVMVAQAGASHEAPVSNVAGYANPVWATTSEFSISSGSFFKQTLEIVAMATPSVLLHPNFIFVFAAIRRIDTQARVCMLRITACDERSARMQFVRDYVLSLAARLPVSGGVA